MDTEKERELVENAILEFFWSGNLVGMREYVDQYDPEEMERVLNKYEDKIVECAERLHEEIAKMAKALVK